MSWSIAGLIFGLLVGIVAFIIGAVLDVGGIFPKELREQVEAERKKRETEMEARDAYVKQQRDALDQNQKMLKLLEQQRDAMDEKRNRKL